MGAVARRPVPQHHEADSGHLFVLEQACGACRLGGTCDHLRMVFVVRYPHQIAIAGFWKTYCNATKN